LPPDVVSLALAELDRLALVEFIPVVVSVVPVLALPVLFMPDILPVEFVPLVDLPELFIPLIEPLLMPDEPCMVLLVAPLGLFWLLVLPVAEVVADVLPPVEGSAAKAGAAASSPNAQTEASRRPLSMFYSLPDTVAEALDAARQVPAASHSRTTRNVGRAKRAAHHNRLHWANIKVPIAFA
jgi:hypothetical protein